MRLIFAVLVMLLAAGCVSPVPEGVRFFLNGKTEEQLRRESLECERDAIQVANALLFDTGQEFYRRCMTTRGYEEIREEVKRPTAAEQRSTSANAVSASATSNRVQQLKSSLSEAGPL